MEALLQDIRFAFRMLGKNPWFSAVVIMVMAIGIGGTTAMFSVVDALLLRPLPYRAPERVVMVMDRPLFGRDFHAIREAATSFETVMARSGELFILLDGDAPERVWSHKVSPEYFQVLDAKLLLGRSFSPDEGAPGNDQVTILGYDLWQRVFASDPSIIGRSIHLSGKLFTVIGVMAKDHVDDGFAPLWTVSKYESPEEREGNVGVGGRLKPGVDVAAASAEVSAILQRLAVEHGVTRRPDRTGVSLLQELWAQNIRPATLMVSAAIALLLLIACANVAHLLLTRATSRQAEIAIRASLGATPGRIIRQLLTESAVLGLLAGMLGLLLAMWGVDLLALGLAPNLPTAHAAGVNGRAFAFAAAISLGTALGFGLIPAIEASRRDMHASLKEGGARATAGGRRALARHVLVTVEIALSLSLCAGAGVLAKSFARLASVELGFDPHGISVFHVKLWGPRYEIPEAQRRFAEAAAMKMRTLPGVTSVAVANHFPMSFEWSANHRVETEGRAPWPKDGAPNVAIRNASPSYLSTLGIPLREGRFFDDGDRATSMRVAVVNETMMRRFWPGESAIGKRILLDGEPEVFEVVGVIGDVRDRTVRHELTAEAVFPIAQHPENSVMFAVRASGSPAALRVTVQAAMRDIDPEQAFATMQNGPFQLGTLDETIGWGLLLPRFCAALVGLFAATALILAAVGVFGVTAYAVQQRTREIGIRMALGARPADVVRLVLKQSAILALFGIGIGLPVAFAATRALRALVYGMSPTDPIALLGAALVLAVVTLVASYLPARRATRVSPMLAIRSD
jgi:putative ABC transport system permease protein